MPYLVFDFDALERCPNVAVACGLKPEQVAYGLLHLWKWCWRAENDVVKPAHIRGFFAGIDASEALEAFDFVEPVDGGLRVRGATRYLKIKAAQRKVGLSSKNLKRGTKRPEPKTPKNSMHSPESTREQLGDLLGSNSEVYSGALPSLTANSEQQLKAFAGHEAVPPAPKPKREPSAAEAFWVWGQDQADNQRPGRVRSAPEPKKLNALLKAPLTQVGRKGLELAWGRYLADPYAAERDWPLELFVSKFSALHNAAAAQPQTREEPKCVVLNPRIATR